MKLIIAFLSLLTLMSCTPEIPYNNETPVPPTIEPPDHTKNDVMKITIGNYRFSATLTTCETTTAFKAMLPLTLNMRDFNNNEKVASLPNSLTTAASNPGTIHSGDIMLYGASSLVVFYETFSTSYSYTRIGQIDNVRELKTALGSGNITMKFELE